MGRWLYPDGELRPYSDVDLLVPPDHHLGAERCLRTLSCRPLGDPAPHARTWTCPPGAPGTIDLHHSYHYVTVTDQLCWDVLAEGAVSIDLGTTTAQSPSPPALATLLVLHAVRADGSSTASADLTRALDRSDDELWRAAAVIAERLGASEAFGEGIRRARGRHEVVEALDLPPLRSPTVALSMSPRPRTTAGFSRLSSAGSPGELLWRLVRELVPTPVHMRSCYPRLARWRPLGLPAAYLVRPVFVAFQAPAGLRAWREIRRSVQPGHASPPSEPEPAQPQSARP
ncbi:MAG: nucleotidyltransferase family protein [Actinomycetota bacterium]|nr:nucleotidyltransferase family protein [Actinomycetota bacterium]